MVDYSRFENINSDDEIDEHLLCTFLYPQHQGIHFSPTMQKFDVRPEICKKFGGFAHGDVLLTEHGYVATAIGVRRCEGKPTLFFHQEGKKGAGLFDKEEQRVCVVGKVSVLLRGAMDDKAPSEGYEFLKPTFRYRCISSEIKTFDIRDEICMKVGGFKHGQVVQCPSGQQSVTIGVLRDQNRVALWFHVRSYPGAGIYQYSELRQLVAIGTEVVHETTMATTTSESEEPDAKRARFKKELDLAIAAERSKLEEQRRQLFEMSSCAVGADIIELNVGGMPMSTTRATLCSAGEGSMLCAMFSGSWEAGHKRDTQGRIFIDADPEFFSYLLTVLRLKAIENPAMPILMPQIAEHRQTTFKAFGEYYAAPLFEGTRFKAGGEVRLHGLQTHVELNDSRGWLMYFDNATQKWVVKLKNGMEVSASECVLELVGPAPCRLAIA